MNTKPRQRYTAEFKAQAVELISTDKPVSKIAEELYSTNGSRTAGPTPRINENIHQTTGHGIRRICATLDLPRIS